MIMNGFSLGLALLTLAAMNGPAAQNPLFQGAAEKGVPMSDGTRVKLPPPILADGLVAAGQQAALAKVADVRSPSRSWWPSPITHPWWSKSAR